MPGRNSVFRTQDARHSGPHPSQDPAFVLRRWVWPHATPDRTGAHITPAVHRNRAVEFRMSARGWAKRSENRSLIAHCTVDSAPCTVGCADRSRRNARPERARRRARVVRQAARRWPRSGSRVGGADPGSNAEPAARLTRRQVGKHSMAVGRPPLP
jgi:hypothetical protein